MTKRKSNKPPAVQAAVAARRASGQSMRQIAKDLEISRNTVTAILSEAELSQFVERSKSIIFSALPDITTTFADHAKKEPAVAQEVCERFKIIPAKQDATVGGNIFIGIGNLPRPDAGKPVLKEPETVGSLASPV